MERNEGARACGVASNFAAQLAPLERPASCERQAAIRRCFQSETESWLSRNLVAGDAVSGLTGGTLVEGERISQALKLSFSDDEQGAIVMQTLGARVTILRVVQRHLNAAALVLIGPARMTHAGIESRALG